MRKLLFILLSITMTVGVVGFAFSEDRTLSDKPVLVNWKFTPEVSTDIGFNLDKGSYGLAGAANIDIESEIIGKANQEFTGSGLAYGSIVAKDIELKFTVEDKEDEYDSTEDTTSTIQLTIGEIIGMVHIGPAYIKVHALSHDEVNVVNSTKTAFSVINYDIINPHYTGAYRGKTVITDDPTLNRNTGAVGSVEQELDDDDNPVFFNRDPVLNIPSETIDYSFGDSGALLFGLDLPNLLKLELGFSTQFGFNEIRDYDYNPYSVSLLIAINAVQNLSIEIKTALQAGRETDVVLPNSFGVNDPLGNLPTSRTDGGRKQRKGILDEGNPVALSTSVGYTLPLGNDLEIVPTVAADLRFENKQSFANNIIAIAESQGQGQLDNPSIFTTHYEIGVGARILWTAKGVKEDESDYLSMATEDVEVSDGFSLGVVYGQVPYVDIRQLASPYVGLKLAMWESEDDGKPGLVPGLKLGLVANVNYALGGTIDIKDDFKTVDGTALYSKYEFEYESRLDLGWGIEASYQYNFIKPYIGVLHKWFDITEANNKSTQTPTGAGPLSPAGQATVTNFSDNTELIVKDGDLRAKIGVEVTKIVPFTTFTLEWQSGNLFLDEVYDKDMNFGADDIDDTAFFKDNQVYGPSYTQTSGKLGFVKLGVKVSF